VAIQLPCLHLAVLGVGDEDAIMIVIDRNIRDAQRRVARLELGHERAAIIIAREYLHSMIGRIGDKQETPMMVERQA